MLSNVCLLTVWLLFALLIIIDKQCASLSADRLQSRCDPTTEVWIDRVPHRGCYPIVALNERCDFDRQCSAVTRNSFCTWSITVLFGSDNDQIGPICRCSPGFTSTYDHRTCVPDRKCSFHSHMAQADCPSMKQFCDRQGTCRCIPSHGLAYNGECVPIVKTSGDTERYWQVRSIDDLSRTVYTWHRFDVILFGVLLLILIILVTVATRQSKQIAAAKPAQNGYTVLSLPS